MSGIARVRSDGRKGADGRGHNELDEKLGAHVEAVRAQARLLDRRFGQLRRGPLVGRWVVFAEGGICSHHASALGAHRAARRDPGLEKPFVIRQISDEQPSYVRRHPTR